MNKISKLSVVITCVKKDKKFLQKCLSSLERSAKYAKVRIEIIIVLNGTKLTQRLKLKSKIAYIALKKNIGFGQAINKGMKIARNHWCIILAPDTISNNDTIINLLDHINIPLIAIITPKINLKDGLDFTLNPFPSLLTIFLEQTYFYKLPFQILKLPNSDSSLYEYSHDASAVASTFWLINRKVFRIIGGFDPRFFLFSDDFDLCKRIIEKGYRIRYCNKSSIYHLGHQSNEGIPNAKLYFQGLSLYLNKYHSSFYFRIASLMYFIGSTVRFFYWNIKKIYYKEDYKGKVIFNRNMLKYSFQGLIKGI